MQAAEPAKISHPKPPSIAADKRTVFPCQLVVFNNVRVIPGDDSAKRVICHDDVTSGPRWTCLWYPQLQAFEVTWYPALKTRAPEVGYISMASVETFYLKAEAK